MGRFDSWTKRLEVVTNVCIVVVSVLLAWVLVRQRLLSPNHRSARTENEIAVGDPVSLASVNWKAHRQTLVVALNKDCHFCSESASFYRHILKAAHGEETHVIAVLPHSAEESRAYLDSLGVQIGDIRGGFATLRIRATPTLLLVNDQGRLIKKWTGRLSASLEEEVVAAVRPGVSAKPISTDLGPKSVEERAVAGR